MPDHGAPRSRRLTGSAAWLSSAVRIAFGMVWLTDAALKWLPGFRATYMDTIMEQAQGQPPWLQPWFDFWIRFQHPAPGFFAYLVATVETLLALALIFGFARKLTYIAGAAFSLLIWTTVEGFGGPYMRGASDVGAGLIYALLFLSLLAAHAQLGTNRLTVDAWLERRVSWWSRLAETRGVAGPAE